MKKDTFEREAGEIMQAAAKYVVQRGAYPQDYIYHRDFFQIKKALQKGVPFWKARDLYKGLFEEQVEADAREIRRYLPRRDDPALEESGWFFGNNGKVPDYDPYSNQDLASFFSMPLQDCKSPRFRKGSGIRKLGKTLLSASLIAALVGTSFASVHSPSLNAISVYHPHYNENSLLDKDHNLAVSLGEMLNGFSAQGFDAIGAYLGHTFFFENLDHDGDGIIDLDEKIVYYTDPTKADTDGDSLNDNLEIFKTKTDPLKKDTDGDGLDDNLEFQIGTDPLNPDTLGRGFGDYYESTHLHASATSDGTDIFGCSHICLYLDPQLEGKIEEAIINIEIEKTNGGVIEKQKFVKDEIDEKFIKNGGRSTYLEVKECDQPFWYMLKEVTATIDIKTTEPVALNSLKAS